MTAVDFSERIRIGIAAGVYDKEVVINMFINKGCFSAAEAPEEIIREIINDLERTS